MSITSPHTTSAQAADISSAIRALSEISTQAGERMTTLSRAALRTGIELAEQNAGHAEEWAKVLAANAQRFASMTRAAEANAKDAQGLPQLWSMEVQWMSDSARAATLLSQDIWQTLMHANTRWAQTVAAQSAQNLQQTLRVFNGNGSTREPGHSALAEKSNGMGTFAFTPLLDWMNQATQAMSLAALSAAQSASADASGTANPSVTRRRGESASAKRN